MPLSVPATHQMVVPAAVPTHQVTSLRADASRVWRPYILRPADNLFDLALRHRTSVDALSSYNGISADTVLHPGQRIMLPGISPAANAPTSATSSRSSGDSDHVVRPGDTVSGIAQRARVSVSALLRANALAADAVILPGQRLTVPHGRILAAAATKSSRNQNARTGSRVVTVRGSDTLSAIAARNGVSIPSILKANGLAATEPIHPGQRLRLVGVSLPATTAAPRPAAASRTAAAVAANRRYLNAHPGPDRSTVKVLIAQEARRQGVDTTLALAIAWQESRWSQRAVSEANALGVMQCLPSTGRWVSSMVGRDLDLLQTEDNIACGVGLLRSLQRSATSDQEVVAAYYQGLASVRSRGHFEDTKTYVASVSAHRARM